MTVFSSYPIISVRDCTRLHTSSRASNGYAYQKKHRVKYLGLPKNSRTRCSQRRKQGVVHGILVAQGKAQCILTHWRKVCVVLSRIFRVNVRWLWRCSQGIAVEPIVQAVEACSQILRKYDPQRARTEGGGGLCF